MIASMISWPQQLVESVTGLPGRGWTIVPSRVMTVDRAEGAIILGRLGIDQVG